MRTGTSQSLADYSITESMRTGTSQSYVYHSITEPMRKEGMV